MAKPARSFEMGRDAATGLSGVPRFVSALEDEVVRCNRYARPFCLAFFRFADIVPLNQRMSLKVMLPENMINYFTDLLLQLTRDTDLIARTQDHEFALLLPETDDLGGMIVITRILTSFCDFSEYTGKLELNCSLAHYPWTGDSAKSLWHCTRKLTYRSRGALLDV
jgi:GGDEF domain-containing protein